MAEKKKTKIHMEPASSGDVFLVGITFLGVDLFRTLFFFIGPVIHLVAMWFLRRKYKIDPSEGTSGGGNIIFMALSFIPFLPITYLESMIYMHEYNAAAKRAKDKEEQEQKGQQKKELQRRLAIRKLQEHQALLTVRQKQEVEAQMMEEEQAAELMSGVAALGAMHAAKDSEEEQEAKAEKDLMHMLTQFNAHGTAANDNARQSASSHPVAANDNNKPASSQWGAMPHKEAA